MPLTYEPIATTTLGTSTNTITFSSIPSTYTDLVCVLVPITSGASSYVTGLRFNGDTGSNYTWNYIVGNGASVTADASWSAGGTSSVIRAVASGGISSTPSLIIYNVSSYANSFNKPVLVSTSTDRNGSGDSYRAVGVWQNTAAINSITFVVTSGGINFVSGTIATIYGIKAA
jgi:hypothetical protein